MHVGDTLKAVRLGPCGSCTFLLNTYVQGVIKLGILDHLRGRMETLLVVVE